ncbi:hypothetical protein DER46DRAFT_588103 [Fusarium sp. MPI-SDFR-AT-0072]|nr:hypothetical protein DER46DRAFT_588103 [Fusarium sp. MPI-SDFR-AT-0072]
MVYAVCSTSFLRRHMHPGFCLFIRGTCPSRSKYGSHHSHTSWVRCDTSIHGPRRCICLRNPLCPAVALAYRHWFWSLTVSISHHGTWPTRVNSLKPKSPSRALPLSTAPKSLLRWGSPTVSRKSTSSQLRNLTVQRDRRSMLRDRHYAVSYAHPQLKPLPFCGSILASVGWLGNDASFKLEHCTYAPGAIANLDCYFSLLVSWIWRPIETPTSLLSGLKESCW